jgi:hypothetical protein
MSAEMDALQAEVAETSSVIDSAVAFIKGMATQVRDAAGDRTRSVQLANELDAKANALAQAIAAENPAS